MSRKLMATITFAGFALLLAFRDIATELWLPPDQTATKEKALWLAFFVCATILTLSILQVLFSKQRGFVRKLKTPGAMRKVTMLGLFSGGIYFGIFFIIGKLGAGLSGLMDYGLCPLATVMVGWLMFREKPNADFFGAFLLYLLGLSILMITLGEFIPSWLLAVAMLPPVASALSDGYTKWLLDKDNAGLTKAELLVVRFLPAVIVLYVAAAMTSGTPLPQIDEPLTTLAVAVAGGWMPLMLLCTGLGKAGMEKLAVWEFMIPAVTFFGTLTHHPTHVGLPMLAAALILSGIIISEVKIISRLKGKLDGRSATLMLKKTLSRCIKTAQHYFLKAVQVIQRYFFSTAKSSEVIKQ